MTAIVGASSTRFGKTKETVLELAYQGSLPLVNRCYTDIDFLIVANSYSGEFNGISGVNNLISSGVSLDGVPSLRVDATSGSGGYAIFVASSLLESHVANCVLVLGVEKMSEKGTREVTGTISSLLAPRERVSGASLPALAAVLTKLYMERYGAKREAFAEVAVKNHANGLLNPMAHVQKRVTLEEVLSSRVIADPLTLYEYSPISDGAASLLLVRNSDAYSYTSRPVYIRGVAAHSDSSHLSVRGDLVSLASVRFAAEQAYRLARAHPADIDFAELHDMATSLEVVQSEELGFFGRGEGWQAALEGRTSLSGDKPLNTSGGLNSKGHPIGASGVAQAYEAFLQLTGQAGGRQLDQPSMGLALSMSGFGNSAVVSVYGVEP
jgi:acetyl-CoA acetyltransferase